MGRITAQRNVLGGPLEHCGTEPVTGFYLDGSCTVTATGAEEYVLAILLARWVVGAAVAELRRQQRDWPPVGCATAGR